MMADVTMADATMAEGEDHIMRLTDDLLLLVLRSVPAKEGAFTTMLSRRWRPLWTSSGAVNLVARILENDEERVLDDQAFFAKRNKFVAGAIKALDAFVRAPHPVPVTTLTLRVEGHSGEGIRDFLNREADYRRRPRVLARLLAHPAASVLEELRIAAVDNINGEPMIFEESKYEADSRTFRIRFYSLDLGSLPSNTLRVLDLTNCGEISSLPSFPKLKSLRLRHCNVPLERLQGLVDVAPELSYICLESVLLEEDILDYHPIFDEDDAPQQAPVLRLLRCPKVKVIVIDRCCIKEEGVFQIEAPLLQRFEYKGVLRHLRLSPPSLDLEEAQVTLLDYRQKRERDPNAARLNFWGFLRGFCQANKLNLRLFHLEGFAIASEADMASLLPTLLGVERLELDGVYCPPGENAAKTIGNLLRCCPALKHLRLNLITHKESQEKSTDYAIAFLKRKYEKDFQDSISRFHSWRKHQVVAATHQDDVNFDTVPDLSVLSDHTFECMETCLKTVSLQFLQGVKSSFGVKLVKYFIHNAKHVDKIFIDAGNERIGDHLHSKVQKWVTRSAKRIEILPLPRR